MIPKIILFVGFLSKNLEESFFICNFVAHFAQHNLRNKYNCLYDR